MKFATPTTALLAGVLVLSAPHAHATDPAATTPEVKTQTDTGAPNLVVATVKMDGGWRASKLIGASVYDDANHQVGSVDDLIIAGPDKVSVAIVSVGGFLGIGSKLVAIPYDHLHYDATSKDAKVVMPGATKDTLNQMPGFTYGNS